MLLVVFLLLIAVVITILKTREPMSNADVLTAIKQYGVDDSQKTNKKKVAKKPILGPIAENPVEQEDTSDSTQANNKINLAAYPHIYGPDVPLVPGVKSVSEDADKEPEYNVDLQKLFPSAGGPPQPFLTDFSKFQH